MDTYISTNTGQFGNADIRPVGDWDCVTTTTAEMQRQLGYAARCTNGALEIRSPAR
ncbi:hypothetical protein GCM10011410_05080 [Hoyosella rhizosphaerae]|uniref:Uncharacterized protein n=2 Tax=Hoyosella rhizosphaerae TaxID=1755582 RepID=A0A916U228_9ACTN|nr:hypothetical protein GCM10011410_05080 [Hoyosella rhizosphaerae]